MADDVGLPSPTVKFLPRIFCGQSCPDHHYYSTDCFDASNHNDSPLNKAELMRGQEGEMLEQMGPRLHILLNHHLHGVYLLSRFSNCLWHTDRQRLTTNRLVLHCKIFSVQPVGIHRKSYKIPFDIVFMQRRNSIVFRPGQLGFRHKTLHGRQLTADCRKNVFQPVPLILRLKDPGTGQIFSCF